MSDELSKRGERAMKEGTDKIMKQAQDRIKREKETNKKPVCTIGISVDSDDHEFVNQINDLIIEFLEGAELQGMILKDFTDRAVEIKVGDLTL